MKFGEIENGLHVLHKCDNRRCVNPDHLFLGTNRDNIKDKVSKGRQARGISHYSRKLDDNKVHQIREMIKNGLIAREIAPMFGVTKSVIDHIRTGITWRHVV